MTWPTNAMHSHSVIIDATVYRSMGVLGLGSALLDIWTCVTIDTIFDPPDGGELGGIASSIRGEVERLQHGSASSSLWSEALDGLDSLATQLAGRPILRPTDDETDLAQLLASKNDTARSWRLERGIGVRRIDTGEAVCIAVAMSRGLRFATDDRPAAAAFELLTSATALSSFDALDQMHILGLLDSVEHVEQRLVRMRGPQRPPT